MAIEWKELKSQFGSGLEAKLGPLVRLLVWYDASRPKGSDLPPWRASVSNLHLKTNFSTMEEAQAAAEQVARKHIQRAIEAMNDDKGDENG